MKRVGSHHRFWILPPLGLKPLCLGFLGPPKNWTFFLGGENTRLLDKFWKDFFKMYDISTPHTLFIQIYPTFSKIRSETTRVTGCARPDLRGLLERQVLHHRFLVCPEVTKVTHVGTENVGLIWRSPKEHVACILLFHLLIASLTHNNKSNVSFWKLPFWSTPPSQQLLYLRSNLAGLAKDEVRKPGPGGGLFFFFSAKAKVLASFSPKAHRLNLFCGGDQDSSLQSIDVFPAQLEVKYGKHVPNLWHFCTFDSFDAPKGPHVFR